jgi:hypothetical protein
MQSFGTRLQPLKKEAAASCKNVNLPGFFGLIHRRIIYE